jgi:N-acetylmuramoyl-L-alanine amidase
MISFSAALMCLSMAVHFEARDQPIEGQLAVAHVVMNRAEGDFNKICNVISEKKQFSWWENAKHGKLKFYHDSDDWKASQEVASMVMREGHPDNTKGATFFHATYVRPYWTSSVKKTIKIGDHIFYKTKTSQKS